MPPTNRYGVDIRASDGLRNSDAALLLREQGWQGTLVEGSRHRFDRLKANCADAGNVKLLDETIQPDTVDRLPEDAA